ncbi:RHS repeat-associated core domain-containing protein [candidate division WOR-3 bacterium]|nr:RHS repeat-associated core domain-containing protein [candidate division WOR-3 bacterium]
MNKKEIHSPLVITMEGGPLAQIVKQYKYRAFGDLRFESGTYYDNHKFTGKEEDGSGLYYFGARYYDKSIGRWISPDPASMPSNLNLNDPQTLNPYVYCTNNPLKYIDPNGMYRILYERYAFCTTAGQIAREELASLVPGVGLGYTIFRRATGDITVSPADWALGAIGVIPLISKAGKAIGVGGKVAYGLAIGGRISKGVTTISTIAHLGASEAYVDQVIWGMAKREGIVTSINDAVILQGTKGSDFQEIIKFVNLMNSIKVNWKFENLSEEDQGKYKEKGWDKLVGEAKEDIKW